MPKNRCRLFASPYDSERAVGAWIFGGLYSGSLSSGIEIDEEMRNHLVFCTALFIFVSVTSQFFFFHEIPAGAPRDAMQIGQISHCEF